MATEKVAAIIGGTVVEEVLAVMMVMVEVVLMMISMVLEIVKSGAG